MEEVKSRLQWVDRIVYGPSACDYPGLNGYFEALGEFVDLIKHPTGRRGAQIWQSIARDTGAIPQKNRQLNRDLASIAPNCIYYEVVDGGPRMLMRYVGSSVVEMLGEDLTGRFLHEWTGIAAEKMWREERQTYERQRPCLSVFDLMPADKTFINCHSSVWPLSDPETGTVRYGLDVLDFVSAD